MKEITILSGKGGTGKTSITAALAFFFENTVYCDNDVDAADLHLLFQPKVQQEFPFSSGNKAEIDTDLCNACGVCIAYCRFDAIHFDANGDLFVNPLACEGCRLCERLCMQKAISSLDANANRWFISTTRFGSFIHAQTSPGAENTGKLVTHIRSEAKKIALETAADFILNDGPPGIGCATIASITGTHTVVIVTEPTKAGWHDLKRLLILINSFSTQVCVILNKYDVHIKMANQMKEFLKVKKIPLLACIPFAEEMVLAMVNGKTMLEYDAHSEVSKELGNAYGKLMELVFQDN